MKITIIAVGKLKEKFYRDAVSEYSKRLKRYCKLEIIEVEDEKIPEHLSFDESVKIKEKEADRIIKHIKDKAYVIALEPLGGMYDSVEFAKKIEKIGLFGISHIQFIIGGSLGLHYKINSLADFSISFSKMTFPHQLMRVILLEQIYRGFRITKREPYHK